jgi:hypothetical protein
MSCLIYCQSLSRLKVILLREFTSIPEGYGIPKRLSVPKDHSSQLTPDHYRIRINLLGGFLYLKTFIALALNAPKIADATAITTFKTVSQTDFFIKINDLKIIG